MKKILIIISIAFLMSCVQPMRDITINFTVDMNSIDSINSVGVIGENQPLSWEKPRPLTDIEIDGIFEAVIRIQAAYNFAPFKFMYNEKIIELEGKRNRIVDFTNQKEAYYFAKFDQEQAFQ